MQTQNTMCAVIHSCSSVQTCRLMKLFDATQQWRRKELYSATQKPQNGYADSRRHRDQSPRR